MHFGGFCSIDWGWILVDFGWIWVDVGWIWILMDLGEENGLQIVPFFDPIPRVYFKFVTF